MDPDATVRVTVRGETLEFSTYRELQIDRSDLDTDLARQAAHYARFNFLYESCKSERMELESSLEDVEDELSIDIRNQEGGKKLTETAIKEKVRRDGRWKALARRVRKSATDERFLLVFVKALEQRKDMLISLARSRMAELNMPSADEVERIKRNLLGRSYGG